MGNYERWTKPHATSNNKWTKTVTERKRYENAALPRTIWKREKIKRESWINSPIVNVCWAIGKEWKGTLEYYSIYFGLIELQVICIIRQLG
jgi:hypothetical protein